MLDPATVVASSCLSAFAVLACTELTVEARITRPLQRQIHRMGLWGDRNKGPLPTVASFLADAWTCWFCSSWWHAGWIVPAFTWALDGNVPAALLSLLPAVGAANVLHGLIVGPAASHRSPEASKPVRSIADQLRDLT